MEDSEEFDEDEDFNKQFSEALNSIGFTALGSPITMTFNEINQEETEEDDEEEEFEEIESLSKERKELENLAFALFERGQLKIDFFPRRSRTITSEVVEGFPIDETFASTSFFKVGTLASKILKLYAKNLGMDYFIKVLRGPVVTICMETQNCAIATDKILDPYVPLISRLCDELLDSIIESRDSFPESLLYICTFVYKHVYQKYPSKTLLAVGDIVFARCFCSALLQLGSYGLLPSNLKANLQTSTSLAIIAKVLYHVAKGALFDQTDIKMAALNEYVSKKIPVLNQYLCSFAVEHFEQKLILNFDEEDTHPLIEVLVGKLKAAMHLNPQLLELFLTIMTPEKMRNVQILLAQEDLQIYQFIEQLVSDDMSLVQAICSISDSGSITDSVAEGLTMAFNSKGKASQLLEWILKDEIGGEGKSYRKISSSGAGKNDKLNGVLKEGHLVVPNDSLKQIQSSRSSTFFWKKRWAILKQNCLQIKSKIGDDKILMEINFAECLECVLVKTPKTKISQYFFFDIRTATDTFRFASNKETEASSWANQIDSCIIDVKKPITGENQREAIVKALNLYETICKPTELESFIKLRKEGDMTKQGLKRKTWKKRWFELKDGYLSYYRTKEEEKPLGIINLLSCCGVGISPIKNMCIFVQLPERTYYFVIEQEKDFNDWMSVFQKAVSLNK